MLIFSRVRRGWEKRDSEDFHFEQDSLTWTFVRIRHAPRGQSEAKKRTRVSEIVTFAAFVGFPTRVRKPPMNKIAGPTKTLTKKPFPLSGESLQFYLYLRGFTARARQVRV